MRIFVPKRKVGKRLFTHQCFDLGTSVITAKMYSGDGGFSADGDQITGGGDTTFIIERAKDVYRKNEERLIRKCLEGLYDAARISGNWQKFTPQITHLESRMSWSQRDQLTGQ